MNHCLALKEFWYFKSHYICYLFEKNFYPSINISSVAKSCLTDCDPMDCSTPGFPVHHQLPELAQTHAHQVGDVQSTHPLTSLSSPAFNLSQHQVCLFFFFPNKSVLQIRWAEYWSFSFIISPSNEYS